MKKFSKALAIICAVALVVCAIVIPTSASTVTMPENFVPLNGLDNGTITYWQEQNGTIALNTDTDYVYGDSGTSIKVTASGKWHGVKNRTGVKSHIYGTGLAFWIYLPEDLGVGLIVNVNLGDLTHANNHKYEVIIPATDLTAGEHVIKLPWSYLQNNPNNSPTVRFDTTGAFIFQTTISTAAAPASEKVFYIDSMGIYTEGDSTFVPSTVTMPENYLLIDGFEPDATYPWQSATNSSNNIANQKFNYTEYSTDRGYGTSGTSLLNHWQTPAGNIWGGSNVPGGKFSLECKGDGLTFWAYNTTGALTEFAVSVYQGGWKEKKITLAAGEGVYKISWSEFGVDTALPFTQIKIVKLTNYGRFYIDEIAYYNEDGSCVEHAWENGCDDKCDACGETRVVEGHKYDDAFDADCNNCGADRDIDRVSSTIEFDKEIVVFEDFDDAKLTWEANHSYTSFETSNICGFGNSGNSMHAYWSQRQYNGIKGNGGATKLELKGEGIAFWIYNTGDALTNFYVVLRQNNINYEKKITVNKGEGIFYVPYTDFTKEGVAVNANEIATQISLYALADAGNFYVDQIAYYGEGVNCTHENTTTTNTATYFNDGVETVYCEDCKTTVSETPVSAIKTAPVTFDDAVLDPETNKLTVKWEYSAALSADLVAADNNKALTVKYAFVGGKEYSAKLDTVANFDGQIIIEGINADRFNTTLKV
ncbi:MAG: hypothetical protein J6B80_07560, partial [Clostridia bacterium]|nr:hypothetical protein [Clostridia bacterium]